MKKVLLLLGLAVIVSTRTSVDHWRVLHVHKRGKDVKECLLTGSNRNQSQPHQFCRSLEFIAHQMGNYSRNIIIILETGTLLKSRAIFKNYDFLSIQGQKNIISCRCKTRKDNIGLSFLHVNKLQLVNARVSHCCGTIRIFTSVILIQECSNITIERIKLNNNQFGNALALVNPIGTVSVRKCEFLNNGRKKVAVSGTSFTGGLHIQFSRYTQTTLTVENCIFDHNISPYVDVLGLMKASNFTKWIGNGLGGGIGILLLKNSSGATILITNCTFQRNRAPWGGGICVYLQMKTTNNTVIVANSTFVNNSARNGGGGVQVRLGKLEKDLNNKILFQNIFLEKNWARFGGGTSVNALFVSHITAPGEIVQFINCTWHENFGSYNYAVDLSPYRFQQSSQGYLPIPLFKDVNVQKNHGYKVNKRNQGSTHVTTGVFVVTRFSAQFQGQIMFKDNWYSALYVTSGRAIFDADCTVLFHSNQAIKGGAIAIHGFSALVIHDNSNFLFENNSAARVGGGIYYVSSDQREYFEGRTCFLEYGGSEENITKRGINFTFKGNQARLGGLSIYSESFFSCNFAYYANYDDERNLTKIFDRIGTFKFDSSRLSLASGARNATFNAASPIKTHPGKIMSLPLAMYDEFGHIMHSEFALRVEGNELVQLDNYFTVNNRTRVYGTANQTATLVLSTPQQLYNIDYYIQVKLIPCPPGFYYNNQTNGCWCSADDESHSHQAITKCDYFKFRAYIKGSYWVGYYPSYMQNADHLYTAFYPSLPGNYTRLQLLTNDSHSLSDFICGSSREGVLCGKCKTGYSAFYHSLTREITCGENKHCRVGILFFVLSEIIPTVIFFTIAMIFGIRFSSGSLNGLVFFSQVIDVFTQDVIFSKSYFDGTSSLLTILQNGHQLIYGMLNLDFFSVYPFCLWEGATIMDVLAFKYVTNLTALAMIVLIVIILNCSTKTCTQVCKVKRKDSSVTHGISTFLIICYGQFTRVSFFILTKTYLHGKPGVQPIPVTYYGGLPYFGKEHLPYAIPAIIVTVLLVGMPPLCLILYPLILHLFELCGVSEHPFVSNILHILCINRLMPLFDSFQSCYKDKMRFFAGLCFIFRIAAFLTYVYNETVPPIFLAVFFLGIHSILQPYKSRKHNIVDSSIYLDITIINSFTIFIKSLVKESSGDSIIVFLTFIQLAFIYLPMFSFFLSLVIKLGRKAYSKYNNIMNHFGCCELQQESEIHCAANQAITSITHTSVELQLSAPLLIENTQNEEYTA